MKNTTIEKRKEDFEKNCSILDFDIERGIYALVLARESFADYVLEMRDCADKAESEKGKEIFNKQYDKARQAYMQFVDYVSMMCELYEENKDE